MIWCFKNTEDQIVKIASTSVDYLLICVEENTLIFLHTKFKKKLKNRFLNFYFINRTEILIWCLKNTDDQILKIASIFVNWLLSYLYWEKHGELKNKIYWITYLRKKCCVFFNSPHKAPFRCDSTTTINIFELVVSLKKETIPSIFSSMVEFYRLYLLVYFDSSSDELGVSTLDSSRDDFDLFFTSCCVGFGATQSFLAGLEHNSRTFLNKYRCRSKLNPFGFKSWACTSIGLEELKVLHDWIFFPRFPHIRCRRWLHFGKQKWWNWVIPGNKIFHKLMKFNDTKEVKLVTFQRFTKFCKIFIPLFGCAL